MDTERRRFTRLDLGQQAFLQLGETRRPVDAIGNLSVGGCRLRISGPIKLHRRCSVIIRLHRMAPDLKINGTVLRSDAEETTIRFTEISPENLNHLHNLVRYNADSADRIEEELHSRPGLV